MTAERLFLDTAYILARVNRSDAHHTRAVSFAQRLRTAQEVWTTEAVLVEIGNGLSASHRLEAVRFLEACYATPNILVVSVDTSLMRAGLALYATRPDKGWGLTDCISFVVMRENGLTGAVTSDRHFQQAGYQALLLEP